MKKITITLFTVFLSLCSIKASSQFIPYQYPWKTYFNSTTNQVYMTGYNASNNKLLVIQFTDGDQDWYREFPNPSFSFDDRGLDVVSNSEGDVFVTGYITNLLGNKDIVLLKYSPSGTLEQTEIIDRAGGNDVGVSLAVDEEDNVYIAGYTTGGYNTTDIYVMKYDANLDEEWNTNVEYNDDTYGDNDIATKILVDGNYVYISGYSYRGETNLEDVIRLIYDRETGAKTPNYAEVYQLEGSNERPVNYIITEDRSTQVPVRKSVTTNVCQHDNLGSLYINDYDYLVIRYDYEDQVGIEWVQTRDNGLHQADIPTDVVADANRNIYVTGYTLSTTNEGYNFLTVKYDEDGVEQWASTTSLSGDEQATSIVLDGNNVKVTGYSSSSQNLYLQQTYSQSMGDNNFTPISSTYTPKFLQENSGLKGTVFSGVDKTGNLSTMYIGWNSTSQYYALRKTTPDGKEIYAIEKPLQFEQDNLNSNISYHLAQNYPNPFNPVTSISYSIPQEGFVTLAVYDMTGKEVEKLVDEYKPGGNYVVSFNGAGKTSGVYFYRLHINGFTQTNKMLLIK